MRQARVVLTASSYSSSRTAHKPCNVGRRPEAGKRQRQLRARVLILRSKGTSATESGWEAYITSHFHEQGHNQSISWHAGGW